MSEINQLKLGHFFRQGEKCTTIIITHRLWMLSLLLLVTSFNTSQAKATDFMFAAEKGQLEYHMKETASSGALLNREDGNLPILRVGVSATQDEKFVELSAWQSEHLIPYLGFTQVGQPLITLTQLNIQSWQLRAGKTWGWYETSSLALFLGLENIQVDRNILPSLGSLPLREILDSTHAVIGARAQVPLLNMAQRPLVLSVEANLLPMLRNRLTVNSFGLYDVITIEPGQNIDWRTQLKLNYNPIASLRVWVSLQHQTLTPGSTPFQSWNQNGVPATQVRYPGSQQTLQCIMAGIGGIF